MSNTNSNINANSNINTNYKQGIMNKFYFQKFPSDLINKEVPSTHNDFIFNENLTSEEPEQLKNKNQNLLFSMSTSFVDDQNSTYKDKKYSNNDQNKIQNSNYKQQKSIGVKQYPTSQGNSNVNKND